LDSSSARNVYIDGSEAEMIFQTNLNGETLTPADPAKPWKSLGCTENCYTAKEKRCTCKCGGAFHGLGNAQHYERDGGQTLEVVEEKIETATLTLGDYELRCPNICPDCGGWLGPIEHYEHSGGWIVAGFEKRQWLYKTCQKCDYQWALWKLGVPR